MAIVANRVSYTFDLQGPSLSVDTACSSSLVAFHLGCQSLRARECDHVLIGGVNVMLKPEYTISMCKGKYLSPDGRCKAFDVSGDGYGRGEGAGMIVIKRLSDALAAGDLIYAVVKGTGVNQDGNTPGISVPNPDSQISLLHDVYGQSDIDPATISYVEAHGTGTSVGDPIEAFALGSVLSQGRSADNPCLIGSVKTNIAHLEAAAGVAGAMKAILSIHHDQLPPSIHFNNPNPNIDFANLKLKVQDKLGAWPARNGEPRRAGVNSFGYGGTNAHILLESFAVQNKVEASEPAESSVAVIYPVSARSTEAVKDLAGCYADALSSGGSLENARLTDIAHSLCLRRTHHERRAALVATDREELIAGLRELQEGRVDVLNASTLPELGPCFVYTGMGPQWWGMGKELYRDNSTFRLKADQIGALFLELTGFDAISELLRGENDSRATQTQVAQPLNFLIQVALTEVFRDYGIIPSAIVGHSVGEVSAAAVSGALSLEDAVLISYHRGRLQAEVAGQGGMLAIGLAEQEARAFILGMEDVVSIAAINSPTAVTLSGEIDALDSLEEVLTGEGVFARKLTVEVPYHSVQMDPIRDELLECLKDVAPMEPRIPLWSTVSGSQVMTALHDGAYWWHNVRDSVRFVDSVNGLLHSGYRNFVEVGPHPVLGTSIKECASVQGLECTSTPSLVRNQPEQASLCRTLCRLWESGYSVDWRSQLSENSRYVRLPSYPWQRQRYWEESAATVRQRLGYQGHPLYGHPVIGPRPIRQVELNTQYFPWLIDHRVDGSAVFPGVGYAELAMTLGAPEETQAMSIDDLEFIRPLVIADGDPPVAQTHYDLRTGEFEVYSNLSGEEEGWNLCARGSVRRTPPGPWKGISDLEQARNHCQNEWTPEDIYQRLAETGLDYGPKFRGIRKLFSAEKEILAFVRGPDDGGQHGEAYRMHPTVLDTGLQILAAAADGEGLLQAGKRFLPSRIASVTSYAPIRGAVIVHARLTEISDSGFSGDIDLLSEDGRPLVAMRGALCTLMPGATEKAPPWKSLLYESRWKTLDVSPENPLPENLVAFLPKEESLDYEKLLRENISGRVVICTADEEHVCIDRDHYRFKPGQPLKGLFSEIGDLDAIVWVAGGPLNKDTADSAFAETEAFTELLKALQNMTDPLPPVLLVTRGVHFLGGKYAADDLPNSALWGLARVARLELPNLTLHSLDLEDGDITPVVAELGLLGEAEAETAWRHGQRLGRRIERSQAMTSAAPWPPLRSEHDNAAYVLKSETPGNLDGLRLRRINRVAPGPGEVEVEVKSAPINFKDAMKALGMLSSRVLTPTHFGEELGMECGGVILRIGDGVENFQVGDRVGLSYQGSFRSHITTDTTYMVKLPDSMNLEDGAGLITPMLAAWYALVDRGRVNAGERILIHSATGGAGLSAIQVARWLGAEIYATAGTEERRQYLRDMGIKYVSDSRSLAFYDDIMAWTNGEGIDVVLNTLAGEGLFKGLKLLRPYGRFIEFGKRDIDLNTPVGLAPFNENLDFVAVDFDRLRAERPDECARIMHEVWKRLDAGDFKPLPCTNFPVSQASKAFKIMTRSQHLGKLALSFDDPDVVVHPPIKVENAPVFSGTWVISGGLSGLGLSIAMWAVERGVKNLVLVGRRGPESPEASAGIAEIEKAGARVRAVAADISDLNSVRQLIKECEDVFPAIRGVVHSAAVLEDATIESVTSEQLRRVMNAKIAGALNLHEATRDKELDVFLMFSSISSLMGNAGQAAYASANAFLDSFAQYRRAMGLPALTINWGVIGETGMVARSEGLREQLERLGMNGLNVEQVRNSLDYLTQRDPVQIGVIDADWKRWLSMHPDAAQQSALTDLVEEVGRGVDGDADLSVSLSAMSPVERDSYLVDCIQKVVAGTMRLSLEQIDVAEPIRNLGLDSLMAVELATELERKLGIPVPSMELMTGPSVKQLADKISSRCSNSSVKTD